MPAVSYAKAYGGLRVMPYRTKEKTIQFHCLRRNVILFREPSRVIFEGGSNDLDSLIFQAGKLLRLAPNAHVRWESLSMMQKATFNHNKLKLLHNQSKRFLTWRLKIYIDQLNQLFSASTAEVVYHISVLERLSPTKYPDLPMYIAILNSMLFAQLKKASITNKHGIVIRFKFVQVSSLFHCAVKPERLFPKHEMKRDVMVHRTDQAYKEIYEKVYDVVMKDVGLM